MKKFALLLTGILIFSSCLTSENLPSNVTFEILTIDEYDVPDTFTVGKVDTIAVKYTLPNNCYSFENVYYEVQDTTRIVAINSFVRLEENCSDVEIQEEHKFTVFVSQQEDYVFKFYKGKDNDGKDIFDEVVVPVN
ncbi:hypothetical protein [Polaribacter septentrionalilitoris]|uniref:hypothetical protein n=1 Tax=Polaribacter septentrionalilitoris TaxID=2494657 RepID=UPI001358D4E4|nr:hypothetical protein [Polaribacter septentrionalilitoris]